jgi:hypothetical protein
MSIQTYDRISLTIDGRTYEQPAEISVERTARADYGCDLRALRREPTSVSIECTVPLTSPGDFAELFGRPEPPGASYTTLARRARYGGRKGRRALQRMLARALPIELAWSPWSPRFVGRCVMVGDEVVIKASSRGRRR